MSTAAGNSVAFMSTSALPHERTDSHHRGHSHSGPDISVPLSPFSPRRLFGISSRRLTRPAYKEKEDDAREPSSFIHRIKRHLHIRNWTRRGRLFILVLTVLLLILLIAGDPKKRASSITTRRSTPVKDDAIVPSKAATKAGGKQTATPRLRNAAPDIAPYGVNQPQVQISVPEPVSRDWNAEIVDPVMNTTDGTVGKEELRYRGWEGGRVDGRMLIEEGKEHPIIALMKRAKWRWKTLKARQSKTFAEAVREYQRRYGRMPPKGFDNWYAFARHHKVQLIDEFDIIESDFRLFRAFSGASFRARVAKLSNEGTLWAIRVEDGVVTREGELGHHNRAKGVVDLTTKFTHLLPDLLIWYNGHDGPRINVGWEERMRLEDLVENDAYEEYDPEDTELLPRVPSIAPGWGMPTTCPPDSAVRDSAFEYGHATTDLTGLEMPSLPPGSIGTVIDSFKAYMDVCNNPQYRHFQSTTSWVYPPRATPILPLFSPGVHVHFGDIYTIITEQFELTSPDDPTWEERPFDRLVWRGQTSGCVFTKSVAWKSTHRARLHLLSHTEEGNRSIVVTDDHDIARKVVVPNHRLNPVFLDVGLVGPPVQCTRDDGTCDEMEKVFNGYESRLSFNRANLYKYAGDFDGNSWSGRFRRLMASNAAVIKSTIFREYWTDWAIPWLHFIPVQVDYSDLWDVLAFFRGGPQGEGAHDHLAKEIALAGKAWAAKYCRWEDLEAFTYRQFLEYGRLWADDREAMTYNGEIDGYEPVWIPKST